MVVVTTFRKELVEIKIFKKNHYIRRHFLDKSRDKIRKKIH